MEEVKKVEKTATVVPVPVIPKILIGVPILSWSHEFALAFLEFWTDLMLYPQKDRKFHIGYRFCYRRPVHMAEEELAEFAIASGCTHLLLMDDDILNPSADALMKLLDADKDVIGGIMCTGGFPYAMCAFRRFDRKQRVANMPILKGPARLYEVPADQQVGVQPVDLIPFAFTLIKTSVLKQMKKPWFECDSQAPTDSWFADRLLSKKFGYFAHFDVWLNHKGVTKANRHIYFQLGMHEQETKGSPGMIGMTPDEMRRHEVMMASKLQEAENRVKANVGKDQKFYEKSVKPIAKLVKK